MNNLYSKSVEQVTQSEDQKLPVYVENGIKHESHSHPDILGPSVVEGCKVDIKIEYDSSEDGEVEKDTLHNVKVKSEHDVQLDEEPLCVAQKIKCEVEIEFETEPQSVAQKVKCERDVDEAKEPLCVPEKVNCEFEVGLNTEPLCVVQEIGSTLDIAKINAQAEAKNCPKKVKTVRKKKLELCKVCGKSFSNIKEHVLQHQPKDERPLLQCEACPKLFISKKTLKNHQKNTHLGFRSKCDICNKAVIHLTKHKMQVHHRESLPFSCASCPRRYGSKTELALHRTVHTRDLKYECDICQKKFRLRNSILVHIRAYHQKEKNYTCKICAKAFFSKPSLKTHLESHSEERLYKCGECDKAYKTMDYLRKHHRIIHSDAKNFNCEHCGKTFKRSSDRNHHIRSHTQERPYQCRLCDLRFKYSGSLRKHELAHNKKDST